MRRLRKVRAQEPELTAHPLEPEESEVIGGGSSPINGLHVSTRGGARRSRRDQEEPELDLDEAPIASLFDDPEEVSDG